MQADSRNRRPALIDRLIGLVTGRAETDPQTPPGSGRNIPPPSRAADADRRPILFAAADADASCPVASWLLAAGYRVIPAEGFGLAIGELMAHRHAFRMLVIDIDGFGGPDLVVARLIDLRRRHPTLPVILISGDVQFNDFTTERLAICDVTLRAPVSPAALQLGLAEAAVNNLLWQARQYRRRSGVAD